MKNISVLVISESPLEKIGPDYYGVDPWIRIPLFLSESFLQLTLLAPVTEKKSGERPTAGSWRVPSSKMKIEGLDYYRRYIEYYWLLARRFFNWSSRLSRLADEHDVIVLRGPSPITSMVLRAARRSGKPLVYFILADLATQPDQLYSPNPLKRLFYKTLIRALINEERAAVKLSSVVYAYSNTIAARHGGRGGKIKVTQDPHVSLKDFLRRETSDFKGEIKILRICWLIPSKGVEYLIEAVSMLAAEGIRARLDIVGRERTSGYQESLEKLAASLGVSDRVVFSGWMPYDKISEAYVRNDMQVISSLAEGIPRCIVEGFARGLPLVCTEVGGCKDFLTHGKNALLVPPANARAIADAIKLMRDDAATRRRLQNAGYEYAEAAAFENVGRQIIEDISSSVTVDR